MDAVTAISPALDEVPVLAEEAMKILYATGDIIVIDAKDLKKFAIRTAVVAGYGAYMYFTWKKWGKPMLQEHREHKQFEKSMKAREARKDAEQRLEAKANGYELHKVILKQKGTNRKTPVTVKTPAGTTYKEAVELVEQGKAEIVDSK